MTVPAFFRSRRGRVFRIERSCTDRDGGGVRFALFAYTVQAAPAPRREVAFEVEEEITVEDLRDKLQRRQAVPTPEHIFERLWERMRMDLDVLER